MAEETYGPQDHHDEEEGEATGPSVTPDTDIHDDPDADPDAGGEDADGDSGVPAGGPSPRPGDGGAAADPDGPDDEEAGQEPAGDGSWDGGRMTASSSPAEGAPVGAGRLIANEQNSRIIGVLRAYLTDGSMLELPMDGDAALRVIASWRSGSTLWGEVADPVSSLADASWAALDLDLVVGLLWMPGLPRQRPPRRITVDPAAA